MKTYLLADHRDCIAFDSISEADVRAYLADVAPGLYMPHSDSLEGEHCIGGEHYVSVVFIDDVPSDKYTKREGSYNEISQFISYDQQFDGMDGHELPGNDIDDSYLDFGGPEFDAGEERERKEMAAEYDKYMREYDKK